MVSRMNRRPRRNFPQQNRNGHGNYDSMLDMGRMNSFLYYAQQIIKEMGEEDGTWNSILASIVAKASRMGIKEAQEYIVLTVKNGRLPKETEQPLIELLNRYSKMR
jgi:hypothetical protein